MPVHPTPHLGTYAVVAAGVAAVTSPLLALAWFATGDGAETAAAGTVSAWAEPATSALGPLLTFAEPDAVYATYTLVMAIALPAIPLAALAARSQRASTGTGPERWGWRMALTGYAVLAASLAVAALLVIVSADTLANVTFLAGMVPGMLLSLIGSTVLGLALLASRFRPRPAAWLLALAVPLWLVGGFVLGHNSLGLLPLFVAWALVARPWRRKLSAAAPQAAGPSLAPSASRGSGQPDDWPPPPSPPGPPSRLS